MYGLSGFAKSLNIQNCINSTGNCVHYMYEFSGFCRKSEFCGYVECTKLCTCNGKLCMDCLICRKFKYLELRKFNNKLGTLDVWIVWICKKFEYVELYKFN